uniref:Ras modification protein ERF4 n=1 Tax=Globodera rostochiensis TaxID=31243 RepID=A0A914H1D7_GLORO
MVFIPSILDETKRMALSLRLGNTHELNDRGKRKVALNDCRKLTDFPEELEHYVGRDVWTDFITELNQIYAEAKNLTTIVYLENILGLITCHLSRLCFRSLWSRKLEEAQTLLCEANRQSFVAKGVCVCNPLDKGFRVIEVVLLDEPISTQDEKQEKNVVAEQIVLQPRNNKSLSMVGGNGSEVDGYVNSVGSAKPFGQSHINGNQFLSSNISSFNARIEFAPEGRCIIVKL